MQLLYYDFKRVKDVSAVVDKLCQRIEMEGSLLGATSLGS